MTNKDIRVIRRGFFSLLFFLLFLAPFPAPAQDINVDTQPPIHVRGNAQSAIAGSVPNQIRRAYGFDQMTNQGAGQTIGIVEAYNHPRIENDLAVFSQAFGLPDCTTANGCFQKIFTTGLHPDYHRLSDTVDKIVFPKMARIAQLVYETGFSIANTNRVLEHDNKGPRTGFGSKAEVLKK